MLACAPKGNGDHSQENSHKVPVFSFDTFSYGGQDTVFAPDCSEDQNSYSTAYGLAYSDFYVLGDTVQVDVNGDEADDRLLVFYPRLDAYYSARVRGTLCDQEWDRLLVQLVAMRGRFVVDFISRTAIPNTKNHMNDPVMEIGAVEEGFYVKCYYGSSRRCEVDMVFQKHDTALHLSRIVGECYRVDLSKSVHYNKEIPPSLETRLSVIDLERYMAMPDSL